MLCAIFKPIRKHAKLLCRLFFLKPRRHATEQGDMVRVHMTAWRVQNDRRKAKNEEYTLQHTPLPTSLSPFFTHLSDAAMRVWLFGNTHISFFMHVWLNTMSLSMHVYPHTIQTYIHTHTYVILLDVSKIRLHIYHRFFFIFTLSVCSEQIHISH